MASSFLNGGLDDRLSSARWRNSDPQDADSAFSFLRQPAPTTTTTATTTTTTPSNNNHNTLFNGDSRGHAHRRFTSSFASPFGYSRRAFEEPPVPDIPAAFKQAFSPGDKKKAEYEYLMQKKAERLKQLEQLSRDRERDELDLQRLSEELGYMGGNGMGIKSEPSTPPEYGDPGFPTSLSKPTRFSASNLLSSSTGVFGSRQPKPDSAPNSNSNVTSPPNERARAYNALTGGSGPQSKHNSDEEDAYDDMVDYNHRSAALVNRNSMPVTRRDHSTRNGVPDNSSVLGHVNTHAFLFGDEDKAEPVTNGDHSDSKQRPVSSFYSKDEAGFPVLLRHGSRQDTRQDSRQEGQIGGNHTAMSSSHDLALADDSETSSAQASKRSSFRRSLPPQNYKNEDSPSFASIMSGQVTPTKSNNRHSFGTPFNGAFTSNAATRPGLIGSPPSGASDSSTSSAPKLQSSYSTNDIPTVKNSSQPQQYNGNSNNNSTTAEQRLHSHNASLGRIPVSAMSSNRHSREMSGDAQSDENVFQSMQGPQAALKGNAASTTSSAAPNQASVIASNNFMPAASVAGAQDTSSAAAYNPPSMYQYNPVGFGMQSPVQHMQSPVQNMQSPVQNMQSPVQGAMNMLNAQMGGMALGGQAAWTPQAQMFGQQYQGVQGFSPGYQQYAGNRFAENPPRNGPAQRRTHGSDDTSRFANIPLESLQGEIYTLCKDQHGCRFLQKKLEEHNEAHTELIFNETKTYMVELMTDPFGNYLCQKLLEHTNDDQRTALINNAAPHMVKIALNQHGTRALQKMIEYVVTREQVDTLIVALKDHVVSMIQDLNGNHVIQKCLNRLRSEDVQFIINAVSDNCVVVGTHRHGCCVIQRCIDHATGSQKAQLVSAITNCSFPLVQDPFGNYVLQYIFDQNEDQFSHLLCRTFLGNVPNLSKQKFSSNVIEKCIRIADADTRHEMIQELIKSSDFDRLADDAFANYVIQTAWLHATEQDEIALADRMRPILPRMRHKPHGRRFQIRLAETEKRYGIPNGGSTMMPMSEVSSPQSTPAGPAHASSASQESFYQSPPSSFASPANVFGSYGYNTGSDYSRPSTHRSSNPPLPNLGQYQPGNAQQYGGAYGNMPAGPNPWGSAGVYGQSASHF